jgi:hypothetical protein
MWFQYTPILVAMQHEWSVPVCWLGNHNGPDNYHQDHDIHNFGYYEDDYARYNNIDIFTVNIICWSEFTVRAMCDLRCGASEYPRGDRFSMFPVRFRYAPILVAL